MEQWVTFDTLPDGRIRVYTWAEITGDNPDGQRPGLQ
jgi:hypothetical protein